MDRGDRIELYRRRARRAIGFQPPDELLRIMLAHVDIDAIGFEDWVRKQSLPSLRRRYLVADQKYRAREPRAVAAEEAGWHVRNHRKPPKCHATTPWKSAYAH